MSEATDYVDRLAAAGTAPKEGIPNCPECGRPMKKLTALQWYCFHRDPSPTACNSEKSP